MKAFKLGEKESSFEIPSNLDPYISSNSRQKNIQLTFESKLLDIIQLYDFSTIWIMLPRPDKLTYLGINLSLKK